jgi:hypothetical protein
MTNHRLNPFWFWGLRLLAVAAVPLAFLTIASRTLAPGGELTVKSELWGPAPYVSEPKPGERLAYPDRVTAATEGFPLIGSPLYFDVEPLAGFDSVVQQVTYRNDRGLALELGALASNIDNQFDMRPGEHQLIDRLPWHRLSSGRLLLLQRQQRYASVDQFLADPPAPDTLAVWGALPNVLPFRLPDYEPAAEPWEQEMSLRGRHRAYVYVKDETLNLTFTVQDMNRQLGADAVIVTVYALGGMEPLARAVLNDDGNTAADQKSSGLRTVSVTAAGLAEGAYQVEFTAPADIFIRRIRTAQSRLVFAERLYLGDFVGYSDRITPATVWTGAGRLSALTAHEEGLQDLAVGDRSLSLVEPLVPAVLRQDPSRAVVPVTSPRRDVLLTADGVFSLTAASWFNPLPLPVDWYLTAADLEANGIDYLLADYAAPRTHGESKIVTAQFRADQLARTENGQWRFLVAVPGTDSSQAEFRIQSVSFTFRREPFRWWDWPSRFQQLLAGSWTAEPLIISTGQSYEESPE